MGIPGQHSRPANTRWYAARSSRLKVLGRRPVRAGQVLLNQEGVEVGSICSDAFGASVGGPIAMAFVRPSASVKGSVLKADLRGKFVELEVVALPMMAQRYYRVG